MRRNSYLDRLECVALYVRQSGQSPQHPERRIGRVQRTKQAESRVKTIQREMQRTDSLLANDPDNPDLKELRAALKEEHEQALHSLDRLK